MTMTANRERAAELLDELDRLLTIATSYGTVVREEAHAAADEVRADLVELARREAVAIDYRAAVLATHRAPALTLPERLAAAAALPVIARPTPCPCDLPREHPRALDFCPRHGHA